jgi:predicted nucleic acid-binding protein
MVRMQSNQNRISNDIAISNTGPLVSAFQCGRLDILRIYFLVIYITKSEINELDNLGWRSDIDKAISNNDVTVIESLTKLEQEEAEQIAKKIALKSTDPIWESHLTEAEAMALASQRRELMIDTILLDEKAARDVAKGFGLQYIGFPGILGRAGTDRLLTKNEIYQLLKTCQNQGTHYSDNLIESIAQKGR